MGAKFKEKLGFANQRISMASFIAIARVFLFGVFFLEFWYLGRIIGVRIGHFSIANDYENQAIILSLLLFTLIPAYVLFRGFHPNGFHVYFTNVFKSFRLDIFISFLSGIFIDKTFGGIGSRLYYNIINHLAPERLLILASCLLVIGFILVLRVVWAEFFRKNDKKTPFFISDTEQKLMKDDLLGFVEQAKIFAERVFNQGSPDSIVFGIDAPWGIGKSTFINFCKEYWARSCKEKAIVYSFNPIRYEGGVNLLEKFIDGLVCAVQKSSFVPEIRPLISRYSRFIKGSKGSFSFLGLNFEISPGVYTVDDAFEDLEVALLRFDKKIIIVVDDLDRLNFSSIKDVLFAVKKSFTLPNISYILCYDTDNISVLEKERPDTEKITEFLEKFVNVKTGLYLDNRVLSKYISENLAKALSENSQADPILISKAMGGLIDIYKSGDYHKYLPFIGDIRKLKRIINTMVLLEIEKTDFDNSDFNNGDLIHLLLIYINYPSIFRKIYNTETRGKRGFFSAALPYDDNYPSKPPGQSHGSIRESEYKNSTVYVEYVNDLSKEQRFLLDKIFDITQKFKNPNIDSISQEIKSSYACFNGDGGWTGGKNLEEYLNLIVKLSKPQSHSQYKFYLNRKNEIMDGKEIKDVLSDEIFSYNKSESSHEQFWKIVTNSPYEFNSVVGEKLIKYLLSNIQNYSLFTNKDIGVGFRDDLDFFIVRLLDVVGWSDQDGGHRNNTEENIKEIAEWVFGEGRHSDSGVIETLSKEDRGILGFYDLLVFRLFCSADRGGDIFNLQRALSKHSSPDAPTEGSTRDIAIEEMREVSQRVFKIFKDQYIDKNTNIFELVEGLSVPDFAGKYNVFVQTKITSGEVKNVDAVIGALKSRVKSFSVYQLGNSEVNLGVGCGYYDSAGRGDSNGIKREINDYLFNICFNPTTKQSNYEYFLDYLMINFASTFGSRVDCGYIPNINEFTKVLEKDRLTQYWRDNETTIKSLNLTNKDKTIFAGNYNATYKDSLPKVYAELDKLIQVFEVESNL